MEAGWQTGRGPFFDRAARLVRRVDTVYDIGAGIRPQPFFKPKRHICVEPHREYAKWLRAEGYRVLEMTAVRALRGYQPIGSVFLLDVIEHMEKAEGLESLRLAKIAAACQVVVFTPLGFMRYDFADDALDQWGMHGQHWQTHRSGWTPDDFKGWEILTDPTFHSDSQGAFFAVWRR